MPKYMPKKNTMDAHKIKDSSLGLSYPMLTRSNYTVWSLKMRVLMQAHAIWEAVEPTDPKAVVDNKIDKMALAVIFQAVPDDILLSLADKKSAKEAWEALKTMCSGADRVKKAKVQTLKTEFENLTMKETDVIDDFSMKLNGLVTNIKALGETIEESYVVKKFLRSVPTKFLQITSAIEQFGDLEKMTIEEVIGSLKAHEERMKGKQPENTGGQLLLTEEEWVRREGNDGQLLLTKEEWLKRSKPGGTEMSPNSKFRGNNGNQSGRSSRSRVRCFNCNVLGHYASECRKPKRDKEVNPEANLTQVTDEEPALLLAECHDPKETKLLLNEELVNPKLKQMEKQTDSNIWYLDNGASNHMTGQRTKFRELDEGVTGLVRFGDGSTVEIKGKGSVMFKCKNGEEIVFHEVYYIPTLCNNIISLGQLSENGNKVVLNGNHLWVYDGDGRLMMKVQRSANRLYKILLETSKPACLLSKQEENAWLWHSRLGHVNFQSMVLLSKDEMAYGLPEFVQPKDLCTGCLMSKQTRKPFPGQANFQAKQVLELVHGDLCGPISPTTMAGNKYFLLLVDDFSRVMWIYMLGSKDEALGAFQKFRAQVEREKDKKIKVLRTDRGGEFMSNQFKSYCEENGIIRHFTAPYSPQQNGVVERRNRTVVAMARSLLKEKKIPGVMWGESARHAVYILNRLPTRALSGKTPYETWTGNKPDLSHLRIFGSLAHMKIPSVNVRKLDDRSKRVVYLGREPGTKACRLYDPEAKKIWVSRDVVIEEGKTWDWENESEETIATAPQGSFVVQEIPASEIVGSQNSGGQSIPEGNSDFSATSDRENSVASNPESSAASDRESSAASDHENSVSQHETFSDEDSIETTQSDSSEQPRKFRMLNEVYNESEPVELDEDELMLLGVEEPNSFDQAAVDRAWQKAMEVEINAIERNKTWKLVELPTGHKAIGVKWVYKLKRDANGDVVKHKARLVAKGYVQKKGVDFEEVYAPVTRLETVKLLLALAAKNQWEVHHMDVKSAFLNGELQEIVYVTQPDGFIQEGKEHMVYRLIKALYGLRQAPRAWYAKLNEYLEELGFVKCPYEYAVYTKREGNEVLIVGVYVDDLLITGTSIDIISKFKKQMKEKFEMSDLGKLAYYLGIEVDQQIGFTKLKKAAYSKKLLEKAGLSSCNAVKYPMEANIPLSKDEEGKAINPTIFRSLIGGLRYLVHTRPDIAYSVGVVSRYMERPTTLHMNAVKRILRYVKGTVNYGLIYEQGTGNYLLSGYSDSDLAGCVEDRKSTGGMVFYLNDSLITWVSQKQRCVALSSCEAEFMAANAAACQGVWLSKLLSQITGKRLDPVVIYIDNKSAIDLTKNPVFHGRSKHIDIRFHFIRGCVERGEIQIKFINSGEQRADILTKAMTVVKFERMRELLGIKNLQTEV